MLIRKCTVKLTANFERNLEAAEAFLIEAGAPKAFDVLIDELTDTVIPNLERFPGMGRSFLDRPVRSVEASNGVDRLRAMLGASGGPTELREYLMPDYLLLYAWAASTVYLLSIRHHRQMSFDFKSLWPAV